MAHQGPFDPPQGLGNTFENFQFLTVFGPIWPTLALGHNPGEQTTNGHKRRRGGSHKPQEALFRAPMAPRRIPSWWNLFTRDQGAERSHLGGFGAILGHFWAPANLSRPDWGCSEQ